MLLKIYNVPYILDLIELILTSMIINVAQVHVKEEPFAISRSQP